MDNTAEGSRPVMSEDEVLALVETCSNAGRWGPDDELGTLNFIDPAVRLAAIATVTLGRSVSIGKDLDTVASTANPVPVVHRMLLDRHEDSFSAFDVVEIAPHGFAVTHLDAIGHVYFDGGVYNGRHARDVVSARGMSFGSIMAQRDGIMTRGVLLDIPAARGVRWLTPGEGVYPDDLERAEVLAGTRVRRGDAVIVRVGLSARETVEGREDPSVRAGLMPECIPWLHEREVAVFSGDCIEMIPLPYSRIPMPLHQIALGSMGMPFIDATELEELAAICRELGRYEFLLTVAPLRLIGGTGSAVNPICTF